MIRAERFARSVQAELGRLLNEVKDPRVSEAGLITVTHVQVTDDLSVARVHVALHGADAARGKELVEGLSHASAFIRRELGRVLHAKRVPELRFMIDETDDRADRVEQLLREIAQERK